MQTWIPIPGYDGYKISDQGEVLGKHGRTLKQIRAVRNIGLYVHIGGTTRLIHKLVLLAFEGPSETRITHINGNKLDNRLTNLCYGEPDRKYLGRCSKGHELVGANVEFRGSRHFCVACRLGMPAVRELPEWI